VRYAGCSASLLFLEKNFSTRITQMNANGKEFWSMLRSFGSATRPRVALHPNQRSPKNGARTPRTPKALRAKCSPIRVNSCGSWGTK
jgi:hypothetical protein